MTTNLTNRQDWSVEASSSTFSFISRNSACTSSSSVSPLARKRASVTRASSVLPLLVNHLHWSERH